MAAGGKAKTRTHVKKSRRWRGSYRGMAVAERGVEGGRVRFYRGIGNGAEEEEMIGKGRHRSTSTQDICSIICIPRSSRSMSFYIFFVQKKGSEGPQDDFQTDPNERGNDNLVPVFCREYREHLL